MSIFYWCGDNEAPVATFVATLFIMFETLVYLDSDYYFLKVHIVIEMRQGRS